MGSRGRLDTLAVEPVALHLGDCLDVLRTLPDCSVDSVVTDPPYGLAFMGKRWDYDVPSVDVWAECLRVLKPGGHLLAFAGTRTQHRMAVRIEDAGFEIRDMIAWVYGCLDEATEVATAKGVMPYHKTRIGDLVLCYDVEHGEYTYQPILEIVAYDYSDTAFRLVGDFGEQVVSRNHRVIVECGGSEAFNLAETLGAEARVPVLESLPALRQAIHDAHQGAGRPQQDVQQGVCECVDWACEYQDNPIGEPQGQNDQVLGLRGGSLEAERLASENPYADVQPGMQRGGSRHPMGNSRTQGSGELVGRVGGGAEGTHDGRDESVMEGRLDVPESERRVCGPADQVCALPRSAAGNGAGGRLCDGAPQRGGAGDWSAADAGGVCAPHQPRCDGQPAGKSDAVCNERTAQGIRAWGGHRSAVVRVVPFHYTGKVWCLRVPTGAFVAVRNGVAFPTGNSGFPKSLDVSKAIDKAAGAEREVVGIDHRYVGMSDRAKRALGTIAHGKSQGFVGDPSQITAPATPAARQWQGWGTALKPALEPITVARKPLDGGTVAENVLAWGTGGVNVDGCRVDSGGTHGSAAGAGRGRGHGVHPGHGKYNGVGGVIMPPHPAGRWPANLIHDGSDEVLGLFPHTGVSKGTAQFKTHTAYLAYADATAEPQHGTEIGYGDSGSAARFFYCAKASKRDRGAGLGGTCTVRYNVPIGGALCKDVTMALVESLQRATSESTLRWLTGESGASIMGLCPSDTLSTTLTEISGITTSQILNSLTPSLISAFTQAANCETMSGGNHVASAGSSSGYQPTTMSESQAGSAHGARLVVSQMLSVVSAVGNWKPLTNIHSTVKPTDLMRYLCRLVTPPGGVVLDPFMGSGSTGRGAVLEGFRFIGIERDPEYLAIAEARIRAAQERAAEDAAIPAQLQAALF